MYEPPERAFHQEFTFGRARDIWALGYVILETLGLFCFDFSKTPKVEEFELDRFKASGDLESRKFSVTQECGNEWMDQLEQKAKEFQPRSTGKKLESLLENARNMLKPAPLDRIAAVAAEDRLRILKRNGLPFTSTRVEKRKALSTHLPPKTSADVSADEVILLEKVRWQDAHAEGGLHSWF
jgi:serine/threonine protein kinase